MGNILDLRTKSKVEEFIANAKAAAIHLEGNHPIKDMFDFKDRTYINMTEEQSFEYFNELMEFTLYEQLKYVDYSLFIDIFMVNDKTMVEYIDYLSEQDWSERLGDEVIPFIKINGRWKCTDFGLNALILDMSRLTIVCKDYDHEEIGGLILTMMDYNRKKFNEGMLEKYMLDPVADLQYEKNLDNRDELLRAAKHVNVNGDASFEVNGVYKLIEEVFEINDVKNIYDSEHSDEMKHCVSLIEYHIADIVSRCILFHGENGETKYDINIVDGFDTLLEHFRNLPWSKELPELVYVSFKDKELRFEILNGVVSKRSDIMKEPKEKEGREKC